MSYRSLPFTPSDPPRATLRSRGYDALPDGMTNLRSCIPALLVLLVLLPGCGPSGPVRPATTPPPPIRAEAGLDRVLGRDARALMALFGTPDQDVREESARKLQYASGVCVLDAYLYPPGPGREPVVTHVDARLPTGEDIDRASCIAALSRRREAR